MARVAFKTAAESFPKQGNRELPLTLDFSNSGMVVENLFQEQASSQIETIQSVFIDNSQNAAPLYIIFGGLQRIEAQPYTQGIYPVICPGAVTFVATTSQGIKIPIMLSNSQKDLAVWGPVPGVTVTPPLVNANLSILPLIAGDNVLVPAVAGQSVKFYRGFFTVGAATILELLDGLGGPALMTMYLTAGGSSNFQASGIPWATTSVGNALVLNSSAAVNCYGQTGTVQS